jgi:hypothetical protein
VRQIIVASPFILVFLLLMAGCMAAMVLNFKEYRRTRTEPPIPLDLAEALPRRSGLPWGARFRGQRWPDPNAEPSLLTIESAKRYAGAAERRARRYLLLGDTAIFILAIPSGLFAPMFMQHWPDPPPDSGWIWVGIVLASMLGGISLKVYAAPYWEAIRDAYVDAVDRLTTAQQEAARAPARHRRVSDRVRAAWREFLA